MSPDVSVIMSAYNSESTVEAAVESLLRQRFENFEMLIVEDGSSDRTPELLRRYSDPRIRLLWNETNIGLTRSLNRAFAAARGRYIARQDADDVSMPDRFLKQTAFLDAHPEIALLGTARATLDREGKVVAVRKFPRNPNFCRLLKSNCLVHGSVMMRREVLEQVGGYNELFRYSQDHDLWLRIAKTHRIAILPDPLYGVRRHDSRVTLTKMKQARLFRMLAVNLARDKVPPEILDRIRTEGIDLYYEFLSRRERIEFHTALKKKSLRYRCPTEAQEHSRELVRLCPYRLVERLQLGLMSQRRSPRP